MLDGLHAGTRVGEIIQLVVHPRFGYAHKDCGLPAPKGGQTHLLLTDCIHRMC